MRRGGFFRWLLLALAGGAAAAGFIPWEVTPQINRLLAGSMIGEKAAITVEQARWAPWDSLELIGINIQSKEGGRVFVERAEMRPYFKSFMKGKLGTRWTFGEVRILPDTWGIRSPMAREIFSAGPVTTGGFALLDLERGRTTLKTLSLYGPLLRVETNGWLADRWEGELSMKGELPRKLLEALELQEPAQPAAKPWEPFDFHIRGILAYPEIRFNSSFFTVAIGPQAERAS